MKKILALFLFLNLIPLSLQFQAEEKPRVDSPQPGEQVKGTIIISGNTDLEGFASGGVYFGYPDSGNWFPIANLGKPVRNGPIAQWDTTSIEDGTYRLRIAVILRNGIVAETIVNDVQVNNSSILQASTQPIAVEQKTEVNTPTMQSTPIMQTATPLPVNPAELNNKRLNNVMIISGIGTLGLFMIVIIIRFLKPKHK